MNKKRYEVICFDGFAMWHTHDCRTRDIARQEKAFHRSLKKAVVKRSFLQFPSQFLHIRIWDRQTHLWV